MSIDHIKPGELPNVALVPGTDRHAATGERVKLPSWYGTCEARDTKWTKADMSENSAGSVRRDGGMSATEDAGHGDVDTREKLWTDCEDLIRRIQERVFSGRDKTALQVQFADLLDRQAAITERDAFLRGRASLDDELDEYAKEAADWEDKALHLCEVVKTQAESFTKLEAECAEWKRKCETMKKEGN